MDIISVINRKGGVGKTTTCFQIASWLHRKKRKVLAIDLDGQCNFTQTAKSEPDVVGSFELLTRKANIMECVQMRKNSFDLISADENLSTADITIQDTGKEFRLKEALQGLDKSYTNIIIDTPPNFGILTTNALTASNRVIIAAQADVYSSSGLIQLYNSIKVIRQYCNADLKIDGILLTRYNARTTFSTHVKESFEKVAAEMGTRLYPICIRESITVKESQAAQKSVFEYDAKSNVAKDFEQLMKEIF